MSETSNKFLSDDVIELVADMLAKRWRKGQIKNALAELNGGERLSRATCENALSQARALLLSRTKPSEDHKAEAIGFYEAIIRDEDLPMRDKLAAQGALREVLGLDYKYNPEGENAEDAAAAIRHAMSAMDETVGSDDHESEDAS